MKMVESCNNFEYANCVNELNALQLNKRQLEWALLLCEVGNVQDFKSVYYNSASPELAIMAYRRQLHCTEQCLIIRSHIYKAFKGKRSKELHILFNYLFLEVISDKDYCCLIECIDGDYKNLESICDIQLKNTGLKLRRVLLLHSFA